MELLVCAQCGSPLDQPSGAGRRRVYCSTACRRLAEMAIRRLSRRLEYLEEVMSHARIFVDASGYGESAEERQARIKRVTAEIGLSEQRLRELLTEEEKTT